MNLKYTYKNLIISMYLHQKRRMRFIEITEPIVCEGKYIDICRLYDILEMKQFQKALKGAQHWVVDLISALIENKNES